MPGVVTVHDWRKAHPEFAEGFAQARLRGCDRIAADALEIADAAAEDIRTDDKGMVSLDPAAVAAAKLRVWTRLELLKCWDPNRYGPKPNSTNVNVGVGVQVNVLGPDERKRLQDKKREALERGEAQRN